MPRVKKKIKVADEVMIGEEPVITGTEMDSDIIRYMNWYNYSCDIKFSKKWIFEWMKEQKYSSKDISAFKKVNEKLLKQTYASISRLLSRGLINSSLEKNLRTYIKNMLSTVKQTNAKVEVTVEVKKLKEPENQVIADLDDLLDSFYKSNYKTIQSCADKVKGANSTDIKAAIKYFTDLLTELQSIDDDASLRECYKHLKKVQLKRYIEQVNGFIADLSTGNVKNKRIVRKPRKKKLKTVDQLVSNVKYAQGSNDLNIVSIEPTKIIDSSILWIYNVKTKKVTKFETDGTTKLSVKGTTIINYDSSKSFTKTIRKPSDVLSQILTEPKKRLETSIKALKTKESEATGRLNEYTLLLRAFK